MLEAIYERGRKYTYMPASNLERGHDSLANLKILNLRTHGFYNAAKLVAENVALFHLYDAAMEKVEVATTDGAAGHL